jgi:hypothetical protein
MQLHRRCLSLGGFLRMKVGVLSNVELTGRRRQGALAAKCMMNRKRLAAKVTCRWRSG